MATGSLATTAYMKETTLVETFIECKDFFYQMSKSLSGVLGACILPHKKLREPLFDLFYSFIDNEYVALH